MFKKLKNRFRKKIKLTNLLKATEKEKLIHYEAAIVVYNDETAKHFTINSWLIFRQGIIDNLYMKRLCKVYFVTKIVFESNISNNLKSV